MTCRCLHGGVPRISGAGNTWWTSGVTPSGRRCTMHDGRGLCWCQVHYTIKVTLHSLNMLLDGYANLCLYSNAQYCIISNHLAFFLQSSAHGGQPCTQFKAWALAHKGKATIHSRLSDYTSMAKDVHVPEYDPSTQDLDGEIVMRVGGGRSIGGTRLATSHSIRPLLPLSPRFEWGARAQARPYALGRTQHNPGWRHSRLFQFQSSFIDFYIRLLCIVT